MYSHYFREENSHKQHSDAPENLVYDVADKERRQIADQLRQVSFIVSFIMILAQIR